MTNQQIITAHVGEYKALYAEKFGANPTGWWSFTKWLTGFGAHTFSAQDIELAKELLRCENPTSLTPTF